MTTISTLLLFAVAIILMVVAIARWKVHPFLAILGTALLLAVLLGVPFADIPDVIGKGFGGVFSGIALVIIFGTLIGSVLEHTGGAVALARAVERVVGKRHPRLAMMLIGWIVSIPVFCDSGFVLVSPIGKSLAQRSGTSPVPLMLALAAGLFASHVFIPPTPGPLAAAQSLGLENNLLLVIGIGVLCSIFPLIAGYFFARHIGRKVHSDDESAPDTDPVKSYEELKAGFGKLPSALNALAPLVVPILLMALSSVVAMAHWTGRAADLSLFLGTPVMALAVGAGLAILQLFTARKGDLFYGLTNDTLKTVGPILFVTAAGGVLGKVIASSDMVNYITSHAEAFRSIGIFFPFLLAAILKTAQGSSTVAITTTAGIIAPLMAALGFATPVDAALVVVAIGAGAMTVSHANDSYFWVVTSFGRLSVGNGYRTQTLLTLVIGLAAMLEVFLLSLLF